jgi:hypothetical protein
VEDDQLQKGFPPVAVRIVAMGELTVYMVSDQDLTAIERGSPASTMAGLANTLFSITAGLLGSLLLAGAPQSIYSFTVFTVLMSVCFVGGAILLILSRRYKSEQSAVIKRIRAGKGVPKAPPIEAQQIMADPTDEETH